MPLPIIEQLSCFATSCSLIATEQQSNSNKVAAQQLLLNFTSETTAQRQNNSDLVTAVQVCVVGNQKLWVMKYFKASKVLSNGQIATIFWQQDEWCKTAMEISVVIGKSISDNKKWYNNHINFNAVKSTGSCGLEGLMFFYSAIKDLQKQYSMLTVEWLDSKRENAYAALKKLGFKKGYYTEHPESKLYYWTK